MATVSFEVRSANGEVSERTHTLLSAQRIMDSLQKIYLEPLWIVQITKAI